MQDENRYTANEDIADNTRKDIESDEKHTPDMTEGGRSAAPSAIGEKIAYFRRQEGMTQAQLAEKLNISAQAVSKWESGLSCPDIMMLIPLSRLFHVTTDMLLDSRSVEELLMHKQVSLAPDGSVLEDDASEEPQVFENKAGKVVNNWLIPLPKEPQIHSLKIDLGAVDARIIEGDHFSVSGCGIEQGDIISVLEDGIWTLKSPPHTAILWGIIKIFDDRKLVITCPKNFRFRVVSIDLEVGSLHSEGINAQKCGINVGVGDVKLKNLSLGSLKAQCGMGTIHMEGSVSGSCRLDCGMGELIMKLKEPLDYGYSASVGLGQISIGTQRVSGCGKQVFNTKSVNFFDINCGMGEVKIGFY